MQKIIILLAFILFSFVSIASARVRTPQNYAIVFGGNDYERKNKENIFFDSFSSTSKSLIEQGWKTKVLYKESAYFSVKAKIPANQVSTAKVSDLLQALDNVINAPIQKNDQLLLMIKTHGRADGSFACEDKLLSYNDPEIIERLKILKEKGVRIGITSEACYGGKAVEVLSEYACVISSQSSTSVSFGFPVSYKMVDLFSDSTKKDLSFSDLYLGTIASGHSQNEAMISGFSVGNTISNSYLSHYSKITEDPSEHMENCNNILNQELSSVYPFTSKWYQKADRDLVCQYFKDNQCLYPSSLIGKVKVHTKSIEDKNKRLQELYDLEEELSGECYGIAWQWYEFKKFPYKYPDKVVDNKSLTLKIDLPINILKIIAPEINSYVNTENENRLEANNFCSIKPLKEVDFDELVNRILSKTDQLLETKLDAKKISTELKKAFLARDLKTTAVELYYLDQIKPIRKKIQHIRNEIKKIQTELDKDRINNTAGQEVNQVKMYAYLQQQRNPNLSAKQKEQMQRCHDFKLKR